MQWFIAQTALWTVVASLGTALAGSGLFAAYFKYRTDAATQRLHEIDKLWKRLDELSQRLDVAYNERDDWISRYRDLKSEFDQLRAEYANVVAYNEELLDQLRGLREKFERRPPTDTL